MFITATKVSRTDLPDEISTAHVVAADTSFTRIVCEILQGCTFVQRRNGRLAQRAIAHRRDIEHAEAVGLPALAVAHHRAEIVIFDMTRKNRMCCPLVTYSLWVGLHTESNCFQLIFSPLVYNGTLPSVERTSVGVRFPKILPQFGTDRFEDIAKITD